jgi:cytochrome c oxidase assembly protein subunit 15
MSAVTEQSKNPLIKLRDAVWNPTPASLRLLALLGVVANTVIIVTGGAVRLTKSGLGCPTWPRCNGSSLVPTAHSDHPAVNQTIEFSNRLLTFLVLAAGIAVFVAARRIRPRRRDVVVLATIQPFSVVAQAIMGGITVLTDLNPISVSAHFLLSIALVAAAVALWVRTGEGDDRPRRLVRGELFWLGSALLGVIAVLLLVGTIVTGSGPHAGDDKAPRYHFAIDKVAQLHADLVWLTVGLTFALLLGARLTGAPARIQKWALALLVIEFGQGAIGYTQYWSNDPAVLVGTHMFGAALVWIAALRTVFAMRDRGPVPGTEPLPAVVPARTAATPVPTPGD